MLTRISSSSQILLQWIAIVMMTLDHYVMIFHDGSHWIHYLSRFVYPVFAYLVVYNYLYRTSNKKNYLRRILLWGVLSQPIYSWAFDLPFYKLNILFTLFFGLAFIHCHFYLKVKIRSEHALAIAGYIVLVLIFLGLGIFVSYYWMGLALLSTFAYYFHHPSSFSLVGVAINVILLNMITGNWKLGLCALSFFLIVITLSKVAAGLSFYRLSGWVFYCFYPAHIAVLGMIHNLSS